MIVHRALAGLFCTTGLLLLAAELLRDPETTASRGFAGPYAAAMALWCVLGLRLDSGALVAISLVQFAAAATLLAARGRA